MTDIKLPQEVIRELRKRRDGAKTLYGPLHEMFSRYEEIYFMTGAEQPKDTGVDKKDWKVTASPNGRDKVTGLKRILDTGTIHIKVKDSASQDGKHSSSDKIEAGLKKMLQVSGEYKAVRVERDTNLAAILYGPVVMAVNSLDDLIETKKDYDKPADKFVLNQLQNIRKRTPFLLEVINSKNSYPVWGRYGLVGHLQEYTVKGSEIVEEWGGEPGKFKADRDYIVQDFFLYNNRLVECAGTTLFAAEWLTIDEEKKDYNGITSIPIFVRYAGGSTLFHKPEEQLQSFLYAYAKGEWDKRENLFWTYLFTAIYTQGLPGPTILRDPDDTSEILVDYRHGVKIITAKGKLENVQVIDGDVIQLKGLIDAQTGQSTIQDQTIGGNSDVATFSSYVTQMNAGKLPAIDPREAQEMCYADAFMHILQRIKAEGIANDLIAPEDIPDDIELEVTLEPDLAQDDLRNSQIVTQLKNAGANVSDEWLNTNLLKISDSDAMFRQKAKEDIRKAILANIMQKPEIMQQFIAAAMGQPAQPTPPPTPAPTETPPTDPRMMPMQSGPGMETMPKTDAIVPMQERI